MYAAHFETLGCRLNQVESEALARALSDAGLSVDMDPISAASAPRFDVVLCVVNTCTVTSKAEQKARRLIRLLLSRFPSAAVAVTGCYAELGRKEIAAIDERIVVLPGSRKANLAETAPLLAESLLRMEREGSLSGAHIAAELSRFFDEAAVRGSNPFLFSTESFLRHSRPSIKIQDGCASHCSYCAIRLARGRPVSLDAQKVIEGIQRLEDAGHHEVILTGVNLSQYISSFKGQSLDMARLIPLILEHTNHIRLRISSLYPERIDDAFCSAAAHERVLPFFHLSVQSGSDSVLAAMRRPYRREQVITAAEKLRHIKENPFISCDLITGFPGETERDFDHTLSLCEIVRFAWIHAFPFSARPGTEAFSMKGRVRESLARERVKRLGELARREKQAYISGCIGKTISAIAERDKTGGIRHAITDNYLHVRLVNAEEAAVPQGARITVRIEGIASDADLRADMAVFDVLGRLV